MIFLNTTQVTDIVRAIAHSWSQQTAEQRQPWIEAAALDKQRFEAEMAAYDGPLRVPVKDSNSVEVTRIMAPKRPTTAFQFFSTEFRRKLKETPSDELYGLENGELLTHLDRMWGQLTEAEQRPYVTKEIADRRRYERELSTVRKFKSNLHEPAAIPYELVQDMRPCYCNVHVGSNKQWETNHVLQAGNLSFPEFYQHDYSSEPPLYAFPNPSNFSLGNILHSQ